MQRAAFLFLLSVCLWPQPAAARLENVVCDDSARLETQLEGVFGAERHSQAIRGPDALIEVWVQPRTLEWTLVQRYANGTSCILAFGDNWEVLAPSAEPA